MARYRIRTADGQAFDVEGMGAIRRHHPDATITHEIAFDPLGQAVLRPYTGEQPHAPAGDEGDPGGNAGYGDLTVAQLHAGLAERGIDVPSGARKPDLVALMEASDDETRDHMEGSG